MKAICSVVVFLVLIMLAVVGCGSDSSTTTSVYTPPSASSLRVSWDKAIEHVGEYMTVYGPVVDTNYSIVSNGSPTFLNIGKPYPEKGRFTVVIWGSSRGNFRYAPETYLKDRIVYVTGMIEEYRGNAQIEVKYSSSIDVIPK